MQEEFWNFGPIEVEIHMEHSDICRSVSLSLSHWYPGSGVVLDCVDS